MPIQSAAGLPYLLHTNRELGLMLAGRKPLAVFTEGVGHFPDVILRYFRRFEPYVLVGRLVRSDHLSKPSPRSPWSLHRVFFALPGEEWRIGEMLDLLEGEVWSEAHERREGELLGYEGWMNDYHLAQLAKQQPTSVISPPLLPGERSGRAERRTSVAIP